MADMNTKEQSKATSQDSRLNRGTQPTAMRTDGRGRSGGSSFPLLFSLNPHDFHNAGKFEKCWWISAPRTAN